MSMELPSALDNLAASGIVDFDSEAYIKGTAPKYVGAPYHVGLPFDEPLMASPGHHGPNAQLPAQPHKDEFVHEKKEHETPAWKKYLAATLAAAGLIFLAVKLKGKAKTTNTQAGATQVQTVKNKIAAFFKTPINWVKNKINARKAAYIARKGLAPQPVVIPGTTTTGNP